MGCATSKAVTLSHEDLIVPGRTSGRGHYVPHQAVSKKTPKAATFTGTYEMFEKKVLGAGAYGSVRQARHRKLGHVRAVKAVAVNAEDDLGSLRQEISIMKMMDYPNVVKLYETFSEKGSIYFVLEFCGGGQLLDCVLSAQSLTERQAAGAMCQMFGAIRYVHHHNVCHRDVKPENWLLASDAPFETNMLKLIDFGVSRVCEPGEKLHTRIGSAYYVSPEVVIGNYDASADVWSLGVIMFLLLAGELPFNEKNDKATLLKIRKGDFSFRAPQWSTISEDAKGLVSQILVDSVRRSTAADALKHTWVENLAPAAQNHSLGSNVFDSLRRYRSQNQLKKAALRVIADALSEDELSELRRVFAALDKDGDGWITFDDVEIGLQETGHELLQKELHNLAVDSGSTGGMDYTDFLAAALDQRISHQEDLCRAAFHVLDKTKSGTISQEDLFFVLGKNGVEDTSDNASTAAATLLSEIDRSKSGEIGFDDFMHMMRA